MLTAFKTVDDTTSVLKKQCDFQDIYFETGRFIRESQRMLARKLFKFESQRRIESRSEKYYGLRG